MYRNLDNICRVCLNSGSHNIFEKTNIQFSSLTATENVSSFDRLLEKLRYVTMLKIDENEHLPKSICDSCIIHLNVAYNLKKTAVQSDFKLRQYVIECGVNVTSYTTCINTVSIVRPPGILMSSNSSSSPSITTTTTSAIVTQTTPNETGERPPFSVLPIKEEPIDYEVMSDITIETNTEMYDESGPLTEPYPSYTSSSIIARRKEKPSTPFNSSLMVAVNDKSMLASSSTTDVDFINAYITPSASDESPSASSSPIQVIAKNPTASPSTATTETASPQSRTNHKKADATKSPRKNPISPNNTTKNEQTMNLQTNVKQSRELRMLLINFKQKPNPIIRRNSIRTNNRRSSRTSMGLIDAETYNGTMKPIEQGKSNRTSQRTMPDKNPHERLNRTLNNELTRNTTRNASRRKTVGPSTAKNI